MDQLLVTYLSATDESERQQHLDELLLLYASPVVRQTLRRRLGFYVNQLGMNPHNQDAEDLYQEVMTRIVQMLHHLRTSQSKTEIENFQQYVARIASNACIDVLRKKTPARARLKYSFRFLLNRHRDFAEWKADDEILCGFAIWRGSLKPLSSGQESVDLEGRLAGFSSSRFQRENIKQVPLTKLLAELFEWLGGPVELDVMVNILVTLLDVKDHPVESLDDDAKVHMETRLANTTLSSSSRLEEQALMRRLWQAVKALPAEQRDIFCFGFEDDSGRDLFTLLLEAEIVTIPQVAQTFGRSLELILELWSQLPMDDAAIATELKATRGQVYKWRFRALQRLRKQLLPNAG